MLYLSETIIVYRFYKILVNWADNRGESGEYRSALCERDWFSATICADHVAKLFWSGEKIVWYIVLQEK
jgi:hypothetical protein